MVDIALLSAKESPPTALPPLTNFFEHPGQQAAPKPLTDGCHGYSICFEFQPTTAPTPQLCQQPPDMFNAVKAQCGLKHALFTSQDQVAMQDRQNTMKVTLLDEWPKTEALFCQYFEVYVPPAS
ncbi:hypothetical protein ACA910_008825 [Epithemia clementina (nom. ined.)]